MGSEMVSMLPLTFFFFFSSRRRHTRSSRDWSSDVCSSDLGLEAGGDLLQRIGDAGIVLDVRQERCPIGDVDKPGIAQMRGAAEIAHLRGVGLGFAAAADRTSVV